MAVNPIFHPICYQAADMNYENYSTEEFANDPSFQRWVGRTHPGDVDFWDAWIAAHPEKEEEARQASLLVQQLRFRKMHVPDEYVISDWAALEAVMDQKTHRAVLPVRPVARPYLRWAAAVSGLLLLATAAYLLLRPAPDAMIAYHTGYGETLEILLPDSSSIVLNANSHLSFSRDWQPEMAREVTLDGEAYFDVRRLPQAERSPFRVRTGSITVEVLGTRFNVIDRAGDAQVVLNSGKVQLSHRLSGDTLTMAPGDMVRVSQEERSFVKRVVNPEVYSSWTENRWVFDATPIGEIASRIQATYGVPVRIPSDRLRARELSGALNIENLDFLMEALSTSFDIDITREGDTLVFRENP